MKTYLIVQTGVIYFTSTHEITAKNKKEADEKAFNLLCEESPRNIQYDDVQVSDTEIRILDNE